MRVLIVEDEAVAMTYLQRGLKELGYAVDVAVSGEEATAKLEVSNYDLLLLDIGLGGKSGLQVCREIRTANRNEMILMLTARDDVEDRVVGLDCGADDYLTKPYQFRELIARIRALDRRGPIRHMGVLEVGDLILDIKGRRASRAGKFLDLTSKELSLLEYLLQHVGEIVTRQRISEHVWGENYDRSSNLIEVYIQRLRRKVDQEHAVRLIHTQHGQGYMIAVKPKQDHA